MTHAMRKRITSKNTIFKVFGNTNRMVIFKDSFCYGMVFPCYFLLKSIFTNLLIGRQDKCTLKMNSSVSTHMQHCTFALGSNPHVRKYSLFTLKFSTHNKLTQASKTCIAHSLPNGYRTFNIIYSFGFLTLYS